MSTKEREIAKSIANAISALPEGKREYLLGYAEGVLAMTDRARCTETPPAARDSA